MAMHFLHANFLAKIGSATHIILCSGYGSLDSSTFAKHVLTLQLI